MLTWREGLLESLATHKETWDDIESCTLTEDQLDVVFDDGYGGVEGLAFTVWTKKRVHFPITYDGAEWVSSVSRYPDGIPTQHKGGG